MYQTFHNYGVVKSSLIADRVKNLTFHFATRSGISLNAEDLRVPYYKKQLIGLRRIFSLFIISTESHSIAPTIVSTNFPVSSKM